MSWVKNMFGFLSAKDKDPFFFSMKQLTGLEPDDLSLFHLAFKHKSKNTINNERLEFLGDSILDAVVSEIIYKNFPEKDEGSLSKLRSKMVSRNMLNKLGNKLDLIRFLSYRETHTPDGLQNTVGNALEALIGAIYLDQGFEACQQFIRNKILKPHVDWHKLEKEVVDHKSRLFRYCQKHKKKLHFILLEENTQLDHKRFHIALNIDHERVADAFGKSKKTAEQKAAKDYLAGLNVV